jgi:hypothetical protein
LNPSIYWNLNTPELAKNSISGYVYWGKFNIFPTTLSRAKWHTTAIFRLSGRFSLLKHNIVLRKPNFSCCYFNVFFYFMRGSNFRSASNNVFLLLPSYRMKAQSSSLRPHV